MYCLLLSLQVKDETDWMAKYFFSGGTMPSLDLLLYFQQHLALQQQWWVNGKNYSKTLEAWLANQDKFRKAIMPIFGHVSQGNVLCCAVLPLHPRGVTFCCQWPLSVAVHVKCLFRRQSLNKHEASAGLHGQLSAAGWDLP